MFAVHAPEVTAGASVQGASHHPPHARSRRREPAGRARYRRFRLVDMPPKPLTEASRAFGREQRQDRGGCFPGKRCDVFAVSRKRRGSPRPQSAGGVTAAPALFVSWLSRPPGPTSGSASQTACKVRGSSRTRNAWAHSSGSGPGLGTGDWGRVAPQVAAVVLPPVCRASRGVGDRTRRRAERRATPSARRHHERPAGRSGAAIGRWSARVRVGDVAGERPDRRAGAMAIPSMR